MPNQLLSLAEDVQSIRQRVLRGISGNRNAGLHFPGYFLDLDWINIAAEDTRIGLSDGPHCRNPDGSINVAVLAVLADTALANTVRSDMIPGGRLATLHMQLQFTGAPATGNIEASARLAGQSTGTALRQSMTTGTLFANSAAICHASAEFAELKAPPGVKLAPLPWQSESKQVYAELNPRSLEPNEVTIYKAAERSLKAASPQASFIQHFWGGLPKRTANGASHRVTVGPQIGNRVGHVQGGILVGIAAASGSAAVADEMMLSNISACYISPGRGKALSVKSTVIHPGRTVAVVRVEIKTAEGDRVLDAVTQHVARSRPAATDS